MTWEEAINICRIAREEIESCDGSPMAVVQIRELEDYLGQITYPAPAPTIRRTAVGEALWTLVTNGWECTLRRGGDCKPSSAAAEEEGDGE